MCAAKNILHWKPGQGKGWLITQASRTLQHASCTRHYYSLSTYLSTKTDCKSSVQDGITVHTRGSECFCQYIISVARLKISKHDNRIRLYPGKKVYKISLLWFKSQSSEFTTFYLHTLFISLILFLIHHCLVLEYQCKESKEKAFYRGGREVSRFSTTESIFVNFNGMPTRNATCLKEVKEWWSWQKYKSPMVWLWKQVLQL